MKGEVHNLRRRFDIRGAWVVVPAAVAMLAAVGVTTPQAVRLASLRESALRAETDAQSCARMGEGVRAFELAAGVERARAGIELGKRVIPQHCSTIELHSAVRLAARESGWKLSVLNVGEPTPLELPESGDALARRNVEVSGRASFSGLSRLVRSLAMHGYPARVLSMSLSRVEATSNFDTQAILVLFHTLPPAAEVSAPASDASEEN